MADELDRLEALGRTEPPPPDAAFVDALGHRLAGRAPGRPRLPVLLPAAAVLAVVLGIAVLLLGGGGGDDAPSETVLVQAAAETALAPAAPGRVPVTVDLEVVRSPGRAVLTWSAHEGGRYVVLRNRRVVAVYDDARTHVDPRPRARFVVVVLDAGRRPVARSRIR